MSTLPIFQTIELPFEPVNKTSIANWVEKINELEKTKVISPQVFNNKIVIEFANPQSIKKAVILAKEEGIVLLTNTQQLPITGMSCASCASSVASMVNELPGVIEASVNYASHSATIESVAGTLKNEAIKKAIQAIGYDVVIEENEAKVEEVLLEQKSTHLSVLKKNTFWASLFAFPIMVLSMFFMDFPKANYIMFVLSLPVLAVFGKQFYINAFNQAKHGKANMDTLVALSTGIAFVFSAFNTFYPAFWHNRGLHPHVYFEAATVIIAFILIGKYLEEKAKDNTASAVQKLMGLRPKTVTKVFEDGSRKKVSIQSIVIGDTLVALSGENIAVDGFVLEGNSYIDESSITGEPIPVFKEKNHKVFSGSINQKGTFTYVAEKVGSDSLLGQIIETVKQSQNAALNSPAQKMADKIAGIFVPTVIVLAILAFVVWLIFGGENAFSWGFQAFITVLIIACPCALGLATPTAIMVGVGKGAENGILVKNAQSLEIAGKITTLVLDKTGTITSGQPKVVEVFYEENSDKNTVLAALYTIESSSEHPLAAAILEWLELQNFSRQNNSNVVIEIGKGIYTQLGEITYSVGSPVYIESIVPNFSNNLKTFILTHQKNGATVVLLANQNTVLSAISISDTIKHNAKEVIANLTQMGIEVHMLTGDNQNAAEFMANKVGIQHIAAGVLPNQKSRYIQSLQQKGKVVGMVGDGINDSEALAVADISIAMGKGADIAMDVAMMTIISSDLNRLPLAIKLSQATSKTINQNLFWAFIYNIIGIPLAAGVLYPINGFLINPMIAGAAMALSSVSVVANSLRLKWIKI
jgi:Cu2+-exporting ATPase